MNPNGRLGTGQKFTICGETLTIREFSEKYNLLPRLIRDRIKKGVPDDKIFLPVGELDKVKIKPTPKQHSESNSWTESALDCYDIGGDCMKCVAVPDDIKKRCQMRKRIIHIVKFYGKPYDRPEDRNFLKEI